MIVLKKLKGFKENAEVRVRDLLQKLFLQALLKRDSTTDILLGMFLLFLKKLSRKALLKNMLGGIFICLVKRVIFPWTGLHKDRFIVENIVTALTIPVKSH